MKMKGGNLKVKRPEDEAHKKLMKLYGVKHGDELPPGNGETEGRSAGFQ